MYARTIHSTVMMNLERSWVMFLLMKSYLLGADRFDIGPNPHLDAKGI